MFSGDIPDGFKNWSSITGNFFISNNCLNTDLTGALGERVNNNAVIRPFSGEQIMNDSKTFVGSGRRLTQNHCLPISQPTPVPIAN
jgi:hypothetical protein